MTFTLDIDIDLEWSVEGHTIKIQKIRRKFDVDLLIVTYDVNSSQGEA